MPDDRRRLTSLSTSLKTLGGTLSGGAAILTALWQMGMLGGGGAEALTAEDVRGLLAVPTVSERTSPAAPRVETVVETVVVTPAPAEPAPAEPEPASLEIFDGARFDVSFPSGWVVETAEEDKGAYEDTTIHHPGDRRVFLRVDVSDGTPDHEASAREVESLVARQPGYRRLDFSPTILSGRDATRWEFLVLEGGVQMRKVDVFFTDGAGDGVAVLTAAPASRFAAWETIFEQLRASVRPAE